MRILMLGNSFIFVNDLPSLLAELTGAEVVHHTRGGARLAEQLNPDTAMGAATLAALRDEKWDFVILQEMSNGPITARESFLRSTKQLCERIRENGAVPILYATWAYAKGSEKLQSFGMQYDEMADALYAACHAAADENDIPVADVGERFRTLCDRVSLYADDGCHPSPAGTRLAAECIAQTIWEYNLRK